ncbi:hypothetical protein VPH35_116710 [Triticum aestivum]
MALAPRPLATIVFVCQMMAVVLQATTLTCVVFLKALLAAELALNTARLIYEAAQVFFQKLLSAFRWQMMGLDFIENNMRHCAWLKPETCERYKASGVLTLLAWAFTALVACVMLRQQRIWDEDAATADA